MATDWMKVDLELPDKPEVHYIANALNIDSDCVVGKLIRVWQWFNKHTIDGNAHSVTFALVDRLVGVTGFGEAMQFAGWLEQKDRMLVMPKFERHTSESAKSRALAAYRQAKFKNKGNAEGNGDSVTLALPRKEKKRSKPPISPKGDCVGFERFWASWPKSPRKGSKADCLKVWQKRNLDSSITEILAHVAAMSASHDWTKDGGQFIPAPLVYLNKSRWDGAEDSQPRAVIL